MGAMGPSGIRGMLAMFAFAGGLAFAAPAASRPLEPSTPAMPAAFDVGAFFDGNEIKSSVSNFGILARDLQSGGAGFEWPRGSGRKVVYTSGLWLVSNIFGTPRSAMADFGSEFIPGPMTSSGFPGDPTGEVTVYRVYKIGADDLKNPGPDYVDWPTAQGAPVDSTGNPALVGDQMLYCVYNDGASGLHNLMDGGTLPLQVEVKQTVYGFNRPYDLARVMFVDYHLQNRSRFRWPEFYMGLWVDPDIGDPNDDLAGCDTTLNLAYVYDAGTKPAQGDVPPALGIVLLSDTLIGRPSPGVHAFAGYDMAEDPVSYFSALDLVRGLRSDGMSWTCGDSATRFPYSGDPVAGTGCLDSTPGDKRILLSVGPFDVNPDANMDFVFAYLVGSDPNARVPSDNLAAVRRLAETVRSAWRDSFAEVPPIPTRIALGPTFPNPFGNVTELDMTVPAGATVQRIEVLDVRGRLVWTMPAPPTRPGFSRLRWRGETLSGLPAPAGVYLLRVITDAGPLVARTVRLR